MLRNPAQGRSLGGRCFTLSVLLIQQRMREGAEWEFCQTTQYSRCRTENATHAQRDWERPPMFVTCSVRCCRPSPSAERIPLCRSSRWELHFWDFWRASLEKSFVLREYFQDLFTSARVLGRNINTWGLLLAPREQPKPVSADRALALHHHDLSAKKHNNSSPFPPISGRHESWDYRHWSFPFTPPLLRQRQTSSPAWGLGNKSPPTHLLLGPRERESCLEPPPLQAGESWMRGSEPGTNLACAGRQSHKQGKPGTEKRHFTLSAESPKCIKSRPGNRSHTQRRHEAWELLDRYVQADAV